MHAKPDFKTWDSSQIEKTHLQFCTRFSELSLSNKASNFACKTDLSRLPLNNTINQKILNYIVCIKSKDKESFVKQSFLKSFDLYCNGKSSFRSLLMEMSEYFNLPDFNTDLLDTAMIKKLHRFEIRIYTILAKHPSPLSKTKIFQIF